LPKEDSVYGNREEIAIRFVKDHAELQKVMADSAHFVAIKQQREVRLEGERQYVVMGDMLGGEAELLLDSLAQGAGSTDESNLNRRLFLELSPPLQEIVREFTQKGL
jgi:hypothetical protein